MQEYYPLIGMAMYVAILGVVGLLWLRSERAEAEARRRGRLEHGDGESRPAAVGH
jgi:hypothetical protein